MKTDLHKKTGHTGRHTRLKLGKNARGEFKREG